MAGCLQGLKGAVLHEPAPRLRRQGRTPGHPDLNGFGADGWDVLVASRRRRVARAVQVGFVANFEAMVAL